MLRDEWGFDGVVVSDWGAVHDPVEAVAAGLDLRMPGRPDDPRLAALEAGVLEEVVLDAGPPVALLAERTARRVPTARRSTRRPPRPRPSSGCRAACC